MGNVRDIKARLKQAILTWGQSRVTDREDSWAEVGEAILDLDNAAYDRAYKQASSSGTLWRLMAERAEAYSRGKAVAGNAVERLEAERDQARAEVEYLQAQLWAEKVKPTPEFSADYARLQRDYDELRLRYDNRGHGRDQILKSRDRLRSALETLADRYHAQMCYRNRRYPHRRQSCPYVLAVIEANEALAGLGKELPRKLSLGEQREEQVREYTKLRLYGRGYGETTAVEEKLSEPSLPAVCKCHCGCVRCKCGRIVARCDSWGPHKIYELHECALCEDCCKVPEPAIEAVQIGSSEVPCACCCGRVVKQGNMAYRYRHLPPGAVPHLYATRECALRSV